MIGHPAFFTPSKGFSHTIGGILALAAVVFFFCFTQAAGVTVECLSPPRTLSPRSLSTLVFRITNLGPGTDMFQLEFVLPEGFAIVSAPTRMELGPGESKVLLVSLFASPTAPAGTYEITLRAVSESTPARFAEASATVTVLRKAAVELRLPAGRQGWPGGQVAYKLWVINRGNDVDSFRLEARSGWRVELSQELLQLLPEEGAEVTLTLYIPEEAKPGDRDCSRVIVHSVSAPDVGDEGVITTVVSPPPPKEVRGTLFPIVPAALRLTGAWSHGGFSSKVGFNLGGTIAEGRYLALSGELEIQLGGFKFASGEVRYKERDWSITVGDISFAALVASPPTVSLEYRFIPLDLPYAARLYRDVNETTLELSWLGNPFLSIRLSEDGFIIRSSVDTGKVKIEGQAKEGGFTVSLSTPSHGGGSFTGSLSWTKVGGTTVSLSGACGSFCGRIALAYSGSNVRTCFGFRLATSFAGNWKLRASWKFSDKQGLGLHIFDTEALFSLSYGGHPWYCSLTIEHTGSADLLTGARCGAFSVEGKASFRLGPGWTLSLEATLSQGLRADVPGKPSNRFKIELDVPLRGNSWHASLKWGVDNGEQRVSCVISTQGMSLGLSMRPSGFSLSLEARFSTPLPLFKTKGQIEGIVFVDEDLDGKPDPGEEGPAGLLLPPPDHQPARGVLSPTPDAHPGPAEGWGDEERPDPTGAGCFP